MLLKSLTENKNVDRYSFCAVGYTLKVVLEDHSVKPLTHLPNPLRVCKPQAHYLLNTRSAKAKPTICKTLSTLLYIRQTIQKEQLLYYK